MKTKKKPENNVGLMLEDIEIRYAALCGELGDSEYKADQMQKRCVSIKAEMLELNQEAHKLKEAK